jgi:hypothetical protein
VLANPEAWRELDVGAAVLPLRQHGKRWEARVQVAFDLADLTLTAEADGPAAEWEVAALLFDGAGERHWEMLGVWRASPESGTRLAMPVVHERVIDDLAPGRYVLRAFVHDRVTDRFGATVAEIELPAPGSTALSGPIALTPETDRLVKALPLRDGRSRAVEPPSRMERGPLPLGSDPRVPRGTAVSFSTLVCGASPTLVRSAVRPEAGDRAYEARTERVLPAGNGACATLLQTVDTGRLDPRRYHYEVEIGAEGGAKAAFEVLSTD